MNKKIVAFLLTFAILVPGTPNVRAQSYPINGIGAITQAARAIDTFRVKAFNFWPGLEQISTTDPARSVAGPENFQAKVVIKGYRQSDLRNLVTSTRIMTIDNDALAGGSSSGGALAATFGIEGGKTRTATDGSSTLNTKTIDQMTLANPTIVRTTAVHGLVTGDLVYLTNTNSIPAADGPQYVTVTDTTHFTIPVNVTTAGTVGTLTQSRTLNSTTLAFTAADVGRNVSVSAGGMVCKTPFDPKTITANSLANPTVVTVANHGLVTGDLVIIAGTNSTPVINGSRTVTVLDANTFSVNTNATGAGTAGTISSPFNPCQGPYFPPGTIFHGIISSVTAGVATTKPSFLTLATFSNATVIVEPFLIADNGSGQLGNFVMSGLDINFWQGTPKPGQSRFEPEINFGPSNMHEGISFWGKCFLETSGHLSWPWGPKCGNSLDQHGWDRIFVVPNPAAGVGDWTFTCPTNAFCDISSIRFAFVTSADAANRGVTLEVKDPAGNTKWQSASQTVQTLTQTTIYEYSVGGQAASFTRAATTVLYQTFHLPNPLRLQEGWTISTNTTGIDNTCAPCDQFSTITISYEQKLVE